MLFSYIGFVAKMASRASECEYTVHAMMDGTLYTGLEVGNAEGGACVIENRNFNTLTRMCTTYNAPHAGQVGSQFFGFLCDSSNIYDYVSGLSARGTETLEELVDGQLRLANENGARLATASKSDDTLSSIIAHTCGHMHNLDCSIRVQATVSHEILAGFSTAYGEFSCLFDFAEHGYAPSGANRRVNIDMPINGLIFPETSTLQNDRGEIFRYDGQWGSMYFVKPRGETYYSKVRNDGKCMESGCHSDLVSYIASGSHPHDFARFLEGRQSRAENFRPDRFIAGSNHGRSRSNSPARTSADAALAIILTLFVVQGFKASKQTAGRLSRTTKKLFKTSEIEKRKLCARLMTMVAVNDQLVKLIIDMSERVDRAEAERLVQELNKAETQTWLITVEEMYILY